MKKWTRSKLRSLYSSVKRTETRSRGQSSRAIVSIRPLIVSIRNLFVHADTIISKPLCTPLMKKKRVKKINLNRVKYFPNESIASLNTSLALIFINYIHKSTAAELFALQTSHYPETKNIFLLISLNIRRIGNVSNKRCKFR
jgi:hypothetical protein